MAGEADLEPATERGAVDRRNKRFLRGLDPPKQAMNAHEQIEIAAEPRLFGCAARARQQRFEPIEVGAGDEGRLAAGDDHALCLWIGQGLIEGCRKFAERGVVHHIHRAPGHVPNDDRDAVLATG